MTVYATTTQLALVAPAKALAGVSTGDQEDALADASATLDDILGKRFTLPLTAYPRSLTQRTCDIALFNLLSRRGFAAAGDATLYRQRHDAALAWAERVADGKLTLDGVVDSTPAVREGGLVLYTDTRRNFR